jgi:hypothetical protein
MDVFLFVHRKQLIHVGDHLSDENVGVQMNQTERDGTVNKKFQ